MRLRILTRHGHRAGRLEYPLATGLPAFGQEISYRPLLCSQLFVIARNSFFTFKGKNVQVQEVSERLGVRYVLEGSVGKSGNRVRITSQLIDATTGGHLWAERFDRDLTDIFAAQDDVTSQIVSSLALNASEGEKDFCDALRNRTPILRPPGPILGERL